jgi:hypothetical protein
VALYSAENVRFKAASDEANALIEDPDDTVEPVSKPFLRVEHNGLSQWVK